MGVIRKGRLEIMDWKEKRAVHDRPLSRGASSAPVKMIL
jgi:hypothetical protein